MTDASELNVILPDEQNKSNEYALGNNIPNPFERRTVIPYFLSHETQDAYISIKDVAGREIKSYPITADKNSVEVNMNGYEKGIYFYSLSIGSSVIETKRMLVIE